ncbi:MAG: hypothetical protein RH942_19505 [Kiloniellaceae bacterium]
MTDAEALKVYDCLFPTMKAAYAKSDKGDASGYSNWRRYSIQAYVSATHGGRYVQNFANASAKAYGNYENAGTFPAGAKLGKDSFMVNAKGDVSVGPLFLMEKMPAGFNPDSDNWRYTLVMPNGAVAGTTNGEGSANVQFCIGCHMAVTPEQDSVMLLPEEYRVR